MCHILEHWPMSVWMFPRDLMLLHFHQVISSFWSRQTVLCDRELKSFFFCINNLIVMWFLQSIIEVKVTLVLLSWHKFYKHLTVSVYIQSATSLKSCTASTRGNLLHTDHHFPLCCHSLPVQSSLELLCSTCLIQFADEITSYISISLNQVFHFLQYFLKRLQFSLHNFLLPCYLKPCGYSQGNRVSFHIVYTSM